MVATETSSSGLRWIRPVFGHKYTEQLNVRGEAMFSIENEGGRTWTLTDRSGEVDTRISGILYVRDAVAMADKMWANLKSPQTPGPKCDRCKRNSANWMFTRSRMPRRSEVRKVCRNDLDAEMRELAGLRWRIERIW